MKKSNIIIIFAIFVLPLALYYFFNTNSGNDFTAAQANPDKAKVLEFSSPMCYDCKRIEKEIAPLRAMPEYQTITFQKIDVSARTPATDQLITQYNIDVVPTLIFMDKNGKEQGKIQGYMPQAELKGYLNRIK